MDVTEVSAPKKCQIHFWCGRDKERIFICKLREGREVGVGGVIEL
jgi:hypothetical protein